MPIYEVTAPDGKVYEVNAPDGASQADVMAYAQAHYGQPESAPKQWQPKRRTVEDLRTMAGPTEAQSMTGAQQFGTGVAKGVRDFAIGTAQAAVEGGPGGQMASYIARKLGNPVTNPAADYLRGNITEGQQAGRELTDTNAGAAGNVVGAVASAMLPGSLAGKASALPTLAKYGTAALSGAAYGGVAPVGEGDSRAANMASGAALGALGQKTGDLLAASGNKAAAAITPELRKLYDYAKAQGIHLSPAQLSDSGFVKRLTLMLDKLPLSGAPARAQAQKDAGNAALARLMGQEAGTVDQSTMAAAAHDLGQKFDKVFAAGTKYDSQFLHELAAVSHEVRSQMDDTAVRTWNGWLDRLHQQASDGHIPARVLQSLDQSARKAATGGGDRQQVAQAFREMLHENFGRNAPKALKQEWDTIRRQYATMKALEPVVARNPEGGVPLQQIQGAINASKAGRTRRARGNDGELGMLASVGQRMKGPNSSGTAENLQAVGAGAGLLTNPLNTLAALSGGALGSRVLNSKGLASLLMRENPGALRQGIAPYVPAGFLGLTPMAAAANESQPKPKR